MTAAATRLASMAPPQSASGGGLRVAILWTVEKPPPAFGAPPSDLRSDVEATGPGRFATVRGERGVTTLPIALSSEPRRTVPGITTSRTTTPRADEGTALAGPAASFAVRTDLVPINLMILLSGAAAFEAAPAESAASLGWALSPSARELGVEGGLGGGAGSASAPDRCPCLPALMYLVPALNVPDVRSRVVVQLLASIRGCVRLALIAESGDIWRTNSIVLVGLRRGVWCGVCPLDCFTATPGVRGVRNPVTPGVYGERAPIPPACAGDRTPVGVQYRGLADPRPPTIPFMSRALAEDTISSVPRRRERATN
mmetsp:Transcript_15667/g.37751  ORF Transcript_15667/g.37751 Transcript_15667/m.37751 type:complete len:313 (+) Transcript_15667:659-1597(+)